MRTDKHLRVELDAGILSVTLARADKKNALTQSMYLAFGDALEHAMAESSINVVLVDSEGPDFSAGNDIADFVALAKSGEPLENSAVFRFLRLLAGFSKPMIAAVRGRAVGIGTTLLLHCDLVYVANDAKLSTPFVDVALLPEAGSSLLMPARIGHARAFSMFALGEVISGQVAAEWGIANAALAAGEVSARARAAATALAAKSSKSVLLTKHLLHNGALILRTIEAECALLPERVTSPEAQAIYRSFLTRK